MGRESGPAAHLVGRLLRRLTGLLRRILEGFGVHLPDTHRRPDRRPDLGRRGEREAARYLRRQGLRILERNWRARRCEVDIIALSGETLVFVEVKSRTLPPPLDRVAPLDRVLGLERIDPRKALRIRRAALSFRRRLPRWWSACRIDGVVVEFQAGRRGRPVPVEVRWYPALYSLDELD